MPEKEKLIIVRGGGDLATGVIHRLHRSDFRVLVLETEHPAAIRRQVSVCEAVYEGETVVEGMRAVRVQDAAEAEKIWAQNTAKVRLPAQSEAGTETLQAQRIVPVLVDPDGKCIHRLSPDVVVDAILAKRNLGTTIEMAPLTIALGPGFTAGKDVHYVIETMRGHNLGRILSSGTALPDTGIPGKIGGYAAERVIHAPARGYLYGTHRIGDCVEQGETIAEIHCKERKTAVETNGNRSASAVSACSEPGSRIVPVAATISGLIRGLIRDGYPVTEGFKIADIDPRREELANCFTISDKARCIAGSVLELVCAACLN